GATPFPYTTLFRSIETSADVRRNPFVHGGLSRVGERSDAMGAVEGRDHLFGRRPGARDERGTACRKPAVECFARVDDVTGGHHRTRDLWTPDRPAALLTRLRDQGPGFDGHCQLCQAIAKRHDARDALRALPHQKT